MVDHIVSLARVPSGQIEVRDPLRDLSCRVTCPSRSIDRQTERPTDGPIVHQIGLDTIQKWISKPVLARLELLHECSVDFPCFLSSSSAALVSWRRGQRRADGAPAEQQSKHHLRCEFVLLLIVAVVVVVVQVLKSVSRPSDEPVREAARLLVFWLARSPARSPGRRAVAAAELAPLACLSKHESLSPPQITELLSQYWLEQLALSGRVSE